MKNPLCSSLDVDQVTPRSRTHRGERYNPALPKPIKLTRIALGVREESLSKGRNSYAMPEIYHRNCHTYRSRGEYQLNYLYLTHVSGS
jgi:hypothetical protein